jgi:hypothetical protein
MLRLEFTVIPESIIHSPNFGSEHFFTLLVNRPFHALISSVFTLTSTSIHLHPDLLNLWGLQLAFGVEHPRPTSCSHYLVKHQIQPQPASNSQPRGSLYKVG